MRWGVGVWLPPGMRFASCQDRLNQRGHACAPGGQLACPHHKGVDSRYAVRQFPTLHMRLRPDAPCGLAEQPFLKIPLEHPPPCLIDRQRVPVREGAQGAQPWGAGGAQRPPSRSALGAGCKPQAQRAAHRRMGVGGHGSPPSGGLDMGVFSRGRGREGQRP